MPEPSDQELLAQGWFVRSFYERHRNQSWLRRVLTEGNWHGWSVHVCRLDLYDMQHDGGGLHVPNRVHVNSPILGHLVIALDWKSRTQLWVPWKVNNRWAAGRSHWTHVWSPIVWEPPIKDSRPRAGVSTNSN